MQEPKDYTNQYTCHKLRKIIFFILIFMCRDDKITCELANPFKMAYKNLPIMENFAGCIRIYYFKLKLIVSFK